LKLQTDDRSVIDLTRAQREALARSGPRSVPLPGGLTGWCVRRSDDCLCAAVATATQTPIDQVPDPHIDERLAAGDRPGELCSKMWADLSAWARDRGTPLRSWPDPSACRGLWIGLAPHPFPAAMPPFSEHCLVMLDDTILWDPNAAGGLPGLRAKVFSRMHITAGISFPAQQGRMG
jgi:hypothetical protein